jgi:hypothetical protein
MGVKQGAPKQRENKFQSNADGPMIDVASLSKKENVDQAVSNSEA